MKKLILFYQIKKFYKIYGEVVGHNFINKLSDITDDNLYDVLYDINNVMDCYYEVDEWLTKLHKSIVKYRENNTSYLLKAYIIISTLVILWVTISTVEVVTKNLEPNPQYSSINAWKLLIAETQSESTQYTAYGRYYTDGTVVTNATDDGYDSMLWGYSADMISDMKPYDGMPIWIAFDDNGTPNTITDDIILGLVYDRNTAIYDDFETTLSDKFELERDGNNIRIQSIKEVR